MDRLFTFWRKYIQVSRPAREFMEAHAVIRKFDKRVLFSQPGERRDYWCFVLEGLVAGYRYTASGRQVIHWLVGPNDYFTGTQHPFTHRTEHLFIQFLQPGKIVRIPMVQLRHAQRHYPDVGELLQIMKQRKLKQKDRLLKILKQENHTQRYISFQDTLPHLAEALTVEETLAYLNIGKTAYKIARKAYLKRK